MHIKRIRSAYPFFTCGCKCRLRRWRRRHRAGRGCGRDRGNQIHRDLQNIADEQAGAVFDFSQALASAPTVGFVEDFVHGGVKAGRQSFESVSGADLVVDNRAAADVGGQRRGGGEFLAGRGDENGLPDVDDAGAVQVVQVEQHFHVGVILFGDHGAVIILLDDVFKRRGWREGGCYRRRFGDGGSMRRGVGWRHGGGCERRGWGWGFSREPTGGAGKIAGGPQGDEREASHDEKPGQNADERFPGFLFSPVRSQWALRFLLCHDGFPFGLHRQGTVQIILFVI